jgi:hypothetical protein
MSCLWPSRHVNQRGTRSLKDGQDHRVPAIQSAKATHVGDSRFPVPTPCKWQHQFPSEACGVMQCINLAGVPK